MRSCLDLTLMQSVLATKMAETPKQVFDFLKILLTLKTARERELAELKLFCEKRIALLSLES